MATLKALARVEKLVWVLVYGGIILLILGIATQRRDDSLGWALMAVGTVVALLGALLVYVRSLMKDTP